MLVHHGLRLLRDLLYPDHLLLLGRLMGSFAFLGVLLVVFDLLLLAVDNDLTKQNLHSDTDDDVDGEDSVNISLDQITIIMYKAVAIINVFDEDDEQD